MTHVRSVWCIRSLVRIRKRNKILISVAPVAKLGDTWSYLLQQSAFQLDVSYTAGFFFFLQPALWYIRCESR